MLGTYTILWYSIWADVNQRFGKKALFWRGEKPQWYGLKYGKIFTEKHIKLSLKCPQLVQGTVQKCAVVQWHTGQRLVHALPQFRWWLVAEAGLYHNQNSQNRTNLRLQTTLSWTPIMPSKGWPQKCIVKCRDLAVNLFMKVVVIIDH